MSDRLALAVAELVAALRAEIAAEAGPADAPDRLLSVAEAAAMLGLGRAPVRRATGWPPSIREDRAPPARAERRGRGLYRAPFVGGTLGG